jgi:hypothetical protein
VSVFLTLAAVLALYVAACLDYRREQNAAAAKCPCGLCDRRPGQHWPPRIPRQRKEF